MKSEKQKWVDMLKLILTRNINRENMWMCIRYHRHKIVNTAISCGVQQ